MPRKEFMRKEGKKFWKKKLEIWKRLCGVCSKKQTLP